MRSRLLEEDRGDGSWAALLVSALVAVVVVFGRAGPAYAHADYESSTPAKDEVVQAAPAQVDVFFSQEVLKQEGRNFVRVFNEQDAQVSDADGVVDDDNRAHIFATLQPDLPAGRYVVQWMTTSDADNDTDEGAFCFYINVQPSPGQQAACAAFDEDGEAPTEAAATPTQPAAPATVTAAPEVSPTPQPTDTGTNGDEDDGGLSTPAIVGIAIAVAVVVVVAVGGGAIFVRRILQ